MSYVTLKDIGQAAPPQEAPPTPPAPVAPMSTGQMVAGIIGSVLTAGAQVGSTLLKAKMDAKIAKEQAKSEQRQAQIQAQLQAQQAALMASIPPPATEPPMDMTKVALIGGAGLAAVVLIGVLASGGKKKPKSQQYGWGPPPSWGPPPGWGPPPAWGPPQVPTLPGSPVAALPVKKNRPRHRRSA